jgi:hypothetical protein
MTSIKRDPLLTVAKVVLTILIILLCAGLVGCVLGSAGLIFAHALIAPEFAKEFPGCDPWTITAAIVVLLGFTAGLLLLVIWAFRLLRQIVDTVGEGDPFVPINARRLTIMAWLVLAVQLVTLPMGAIGVWLAQMSKDTTFDVDDGISGNGLLLMLVLFVLARVFRQGTAMREELEGTV